MALCIPAANSGTITVNPAPAIVVNNENICIGDDAILTVTVPLSGQQGGVYAWDSGQNTSSITVTPNVTSVYPITYTVNGCSITDTSVVTVNPLPDVGFTADTLQGCVPLTVTLTANFVDPLTTYIWLSLIHI